MAALAALAPAFFPAFDDKDALSMVKRAIEKDSRTTYTCIRVWTAWGRETPVKVRRDQSETGANRVLVLGPVDRQGFTIIDDGNQQATYDPDKRELILQDSPLKVVQAEDASRRFNLLRENYDVRKLGYETVAGRKTLRVRLVPRADESLYERGYWIDTQKAVLLRVEWKSPEGKSQIVSDTLSIEFPKDLPPDTFAKRFSVSTPKEIRIQAPKRHSDIESLSKAVGFEPLSPKMPFGFSFIGAESVKGKSRTMAALRYTDGAANITIYQSLAEDGPPPWHPTAGAPKGPIRGRWIRVEGDVPSRGKRAIYEAVQGSKADAALREEREQCAGRGVFFKDFAREVSFDSGTLLPWGPHLGAIEEVFRVNTSGLESQRRRFQDMRKSD